MAITRLGGANAISGIIPQGNIANASLGAVTALPFNVGITVSDQWRLTTSFTGNADPIANNLERVDAPSGYGTIGSAMTESSGIFTFPSTGIYLVKFNINVNTGAGTTPTVDGLCTSQILVTTNNSSYNIASRVSAGLHDTSGANTCENASETNALIDVTDTSNVKVKFKADSINSTTSVLGNTDHSRTYFTFIRLGDT